MGTSTSAIAPALAATMLAVLASCREDGPTSETCPRLDREVLLDFASTLGCRLQERQPWPSSKAGEPARSSRLDRCDGEVSLWHAVDPKNDRTVFLRTSPLGRDRFEQALDAWERAGVASRVIEELRSKRPENPAVAYHGRDGVVELMIITTSRSEIGTAWDISISCGGIEP